MLAPPTGYADGAGRGVIADPSGEILVGGYVRVIHPIRQSGSRDRRSHPRRGARHGGFRWRNRLRPATPRGIRSTRRNGLARQPDGKLVIGGTAGDVGSFDFFGRALLRQRRSRHRLRIAGGLHRPRISAERPPPAARWRSRTQGSPMSAEMQALSDSGIAAFHAMPPLRPRRGGGGGGGAQPAAPSSPAAKKKCKKQQARGRRREEVQEAEAARSPSHARFREGKVFPAS